MAALPSSSVMACRSQRVEGPSAAQRSRDQARDRDRPATRMLALRGILNAPYSRMPCACVRAREARLGSGRAGWRPFYTYCAMLRLVVPKDPGWPPAQGGKIALQTCDAMPLRLLRRSWEACARRWDARWLPAMGRVSEQPHAPTCAFTSHLARRRPSSLCARRRFQTTATCHRPPARTCPTCPR